MKKCLAGCCLLMSLCVASSCTTKNNQRTDKVETTEESAFSGVHIVPEYARGFVLSYRSGYVLLDIQDPQNEESTTFHYALVRRETVRHPRIVYCDRDTHQKCCLYDIFAVVQFYQDGRTGQGRRGDQYPASVQ